MNAADFIFAGTYGRGMFRSTDSGQNWQQINNGLRAVYESALLITNGYIFVGADFVGGAGGVYRSTDYGDSWVEINHDMIQTDVRALATNPSGHIFAGTYFGGGVFRSTDNGDSWTPVKQRFGLRQHLVSRDHSGRNYLCRNSRMRNRRVSLH
jgi:photosystem II stability/assembly factor-like uncharacterized protein